MTSNETLSTETLKDPSPEHFANCPSLLSSGVDLLGRSRRNFSTAFFSFSSSLVLSVSLVPVVFSSSFSFICLLCARAWEGYHHHHPSSSVWKDDSVFTDDERKRLTDTVSLEKSRKRHSLLLPRRKQKGKLRGRGRRRQRKRSTREAEEGKEEEAARRDGKEVEEKSQNLDICYQFSNSPTSTGKPTESLQSWEKSFSPLSGKRQKENQSLSVTNESFFAKSACID